MPSSFDIEDGRRMIRTPEHVRRCLINRCCPCPGSGIRVLTRVQRERVKLNGFELGHGLSTYSGSASVE